MKLSLSIRYTHEAQRPAVAWLLPGRDSAAWLSELSRWEAAVTEARVVLLPASPGQLDAAACFVLSPAAPHATHLAHGYGLAADRVYLPIEAQFWPEVTPNELHELFPDDEEKYVWHPTLGLIPLPAKMTVRIADLLSRPQERAADWRRAVPGVAFQQRLLSIAPQFVPDIKAMLDEGRGDIGTEELDGDDLPRSPDEPAGGMLGKAGRAAGRGIAKSLGWLAEHAPGASGGDGPGWLDRVANWANDKLDRISRQLATERNREIARLLHLLKTNPDEGLKYALPLGGDAPRGIAPPGGKLGPRDVNYHAGRIGQGGPVAAWDLRQDYENRLRQHYRELANREIALGRHRRAAYIFAELLGDLRSAASTLAAGKHYREAAALYDERLAQPLEAARCLEQAGLVTDAIVIYERLEQFEKVGDLYRLIEREDQARAAYQLAVDKHRAAGDDLAAANLLEGKLADPAAALEELLRAWPARPQAARCFAAAFELMARHVWHERALTTVSKLPATLRDLPHFELAAQQLAATASKYPDAAVRSSAANEMRLLAAARLPSAAMNEASHMTNSLVRLAPHDRLLLRDAQRYLRQMQAERAAAKPAPAKPIRPSRSPTLLREFSLPPATWSAAVQADVAYAAGYRGDEVVLVRFNADGVVQQPTRRPWPVRPGFAHSPILMAAAGRWEPTIYVHILGHESMSGTRAFPATHVMGPAVGGPHVSFSHETAAFCVGHEGRVYSLDEREGVATLSIFLPDHNLLGTPTMQLPPTDGFPRPMLHCEDSAYPLYVGCGPILSMLLGTDDATLELPEPITSLAASAPHARFKLVVGMARGGLLIWDNPSTGKQERFADDLASPAIALIRGGWLLAADAGEIQIYRTQDNKLTIHSHTVGTGKPPVAILPTNHASQFTLLDETGKVLVYAVE